MKELKKSFFALNDDGRFMGSKPNDTIELIFNCLFDGEWNNESKILDGAKEILKQLVDLGYCIIINDVPEKNVALDWIDENIGLPFCCNDYPTRYCDLSDHWTKISRETAIQLCSKDNSNLNRYIQFKGDWNEILKAINENDELIGYKSVHVIYDDIDWNQPKENAGVSCNGESNPELDFIPVEKLNEKTNELLSKIAMKTTDSFSIYTKPIKERWNIDCVNWMVNKDISDKYGVEFFVEQSSLYYRGTWIKIFAKSHHKTAIVLKPILEKFCKDYGFDSKEKIEDFYSLYDLPWSEEQKRREDADDATDAFFDSMN